MNITAINTLINLLENIPPETKQGFNMRYYHENAYGEDVNVGHECGTVACLAGWTAEHLSLKGDRVLKLPRTKDSIKNYGPGLHWMTGHHELAQEILGLTEDEADRLFTPMDYDSNPELDLVAWDRVKPAQAVKVLKHLRDTGEVDWTVAF